MHAEDSSEGATVGSCAGYLPHCIAGWSTDNILSAMHMPCIANASTAHHTVLRCLEFHLLLVNFLFLL